MTRSRIPALCLLLAVVLSACSSGTSTIPHTAAPPSAAGGSLSVDGYTAKFTEYALPPNIVPSDVTVGPDGAIWFANFKTFFASSIVAGQIAGTGAVKLVQLPSLTEGDLTNPYTSGGTIASTGGKLWSMAIEPFRLRDQFLVSIAPSTTAVTLADLEVGCCAEPSPHMTVDRHGNLWAATCTDSCSSFYTLILSFTSTGVHRVSTFIGDPVQTYTPNGIADGPDGNIYVTATYTGLSEGNLIRQEGFVFQLSPDAKILHQFALPPRSEPHGIVAGPDGNLWIAETGAGKIVRMSTGGAVTEFPLSNPNAAPLNIIAGTDGALWFTEFVGNALGRITTGGSITEYPIPTPHAAPYGLASCPAACDNAHGRIWFSEQAGKMGKFEF